MGLGQGSEWVQDRAWFEVRVGVGWVLVYASGTGSSSGYGFRSGLVSELGQCLGSELWLGLGLGLALG